VSEPDSKLGASLAELRRRKVFRVGVGYAVAAFAFLQLMSSIAGAVELTPATMRLLVLGVLGGFPLALFLAWAYDITPRGIERTVEREDAHSSRALELAIIGVLTLAVSGIGYLIYRPGAPAPIAAAQAEVADRSIAVLPFANLSGDPANDYFGDGLAEEILNVLATVPNLRVAARTSSFAYKGRNEDVRRIGNELNVATVLEGSVRKSGDKVRITVQLINVADGFHLWSQNFDRTLSDIFTIQDEIAKAVAEALKVRLLGETSAAAKMGGTGNVAAYDLYLLGRHNMQQRDEQGLLAAVGFFEQALAADPEYARAWSGLADAYNLQIGYGNLTPGKALAKAEPAALRALALDPKLAEAHASLGLIRGGQGREKDAIASFETAIKLDPDYAPAWVWYGTSLMNLDRRKDALAAYEKGYQLDPLLPPAVSNLADQYERLGRYRDAIPLAERMVRLRPIDASDWHAKIGDALTRLGVPGEAVLAYHRALVADPRNAHAMAAMARAWTVLGDLAEAQRWIARAEMAAPLADATMIAKLVLAIARREDDKAIAMVRADLARSPVRRDDLGIQVQLLLVLALADRGGDAAAQLKVIEGMVGPVQVGTVGDTFTAHLAYALKKAKRTADFERIVADGLKAIEARVALGDQRGDLHFAAAELRAVAGQTTEALAEFSLALQRGWIDAPFARRDPLLASLRDDPTYTALLDTMDKSLAAQRETLAKAPPAPFEPPLDAPAVSLAATELDRLVGNYLLGGYSELTQIVRHDDGLAIVRGRHPPAPLRARSALELSEPGLGEQFAFVLGPDGRASHARVRVRGQELRLKRIAFEMPHAGYADKAKYPDYPATYVFEAGFKATVRLKDGRLVMQQDGQAEVELLPSGEDRFFIVGAALNLIFLRDDAGAVTALRVQQVDSELEGKREAPAPTTP